MLLIQQEYISRDACHGLVLVVKDVDRDEIEFELCLPISNNTEHFRSEKLGFVDLAEEVLPGDGEDRGD